MAEESAAKASATPGCDKPRRGCLTVILVAVVLTMLSGCSSGGPAATPTTAAPTTTAKVTTTTALSPFAAIMARSHTVAECAALGLVDAAQIIECTKSSSDLPTTVRDGFLLQVSGDGRASVSYTTGSGIAQEDVELPWAKEIPDPYPAKQQLTAQLRGTGSITCRILSQTDFELATVTSSGAYVIASCMNQ